MPAIWASCRSDISCIARCLRMKSPREPSVMALGIAHRTGTAGRDAGASRPAWPGTSGDEFARGAGVRLRELAGEVGLDGRDVGEPLHLGRAGGLLVAVGQRQDRLLDR